MAEYVSDLIRKLRRKKLISNYQSQYVHFCRRYGLRAGTNYLRLLRITSWSEIVTAFERIEGYKYPLQRHRLILTLKVEDLPKELKFAPQNLCFVSIASTKFKQYKSTGKLTAKDIRLILLAANAIAERYQDNASKVRQKIKGKGVLIDGIGEGIDFLFCSENFLPKTTEVHAILSKVARKSLTNDNVFSLTRALLLSQGWSIIRLHPIDYYLPPSLLVLKN